MMRLIVAVVLAGVTVLFSLPALRQGFDLIAQGGPLLSARLLLDGTGAFAGGTTPLADAVLGGWMALAGTRIGALSLLDALVVGAIAGTGAWLWYPRAGRLGAAAWSFAVLAAAPAPFAVSIALGWACAWNAARSAALRQAMAGAGWITVLALDPRIGISLVPVMLVALPGTAWSSRASWTAMAVAAGVTATIAVASAGWEGAWVRGVVATVADLVARAESGELWRFVHTAIGGVRLHQPFGGWPPTGETPGAAWPGQGIARATALRAIVVVAFVGLAWQLGARRRRTTTSLALALFATALLTLALRGDVNGLRLALLPTGAGLLASAATSKRTWPFALALALLALPLGSETLVRSAQSQRATLVEWDDARGGVRLEEQRARRWTEIRRQLVPRAGEPALVWPVDPGVHWILGTTPLTADGAMPRGVEADRRLATALEVQRPRLVLLGPDPDLLGHRLLERLPRSWAQLRERYRLAGMVRVEQDALRLLAPFDGQGPDPLAQVLPVVELTSANELSPALRSGFQIGQSFRLGPRDLEGFAVRVRTRGTDLAVDVRIQVWQKRATGFDSALVSQRVSTTIAGDGAVAWFRLPVADTAHQDLAITLELRNEVGEELRLDWYVHDEAHEPDFYPEGTALLGLSPVAADLYFLVY